MFALIGVSGIGYVAGLIAVGIYAAVRVRAGADYFASNGVKLAMVIGFALLSAIPTDVFTVMWLTVVRDYVDVTANLNLFLVAVAPVVAGIVAVQALLLSRAYRTRPLLHGAVYLAVYAAAHAFWITLLFNPVQDVVRYALTIFVVGSLTMLLIARLVWRRPA